MPEPGEEHVASLPTPAISALARVEVPAALWRKLAAALAARKADGSIQAFACFDVGLRRAAATHGFALVPATM